MGGLVLVMFFTPSSLMRRSMTVSFMAESVEHAWSQDAMYCKLPKLSEHLCHTAPNLLLCASLQGAFTKS